MDVAIDISQIAYRGTGVSRFVEGLTRSIIDYDRENRWTFLYSSLRQQLSPEIKQLIGRRHTLKEYRLPPTALAFLWNSIHRMKIEKLVGKQDWVITSDWTEPPSRMAKATVIHDLAFIRYPDTVHPSIRQTQQERIRWVKKESKLIFADSEATKKDIVELLGIPEKKIFVNYPGVTFTPSGNDAKHMIKKYGLKKPYILTVGKIEPRKNIGRLIEAYKRIKPVGVDLVVVGTQGWDSLTSKKQSADEHIIFLGYVSDSELAALYEDCLFFIYPSLYEGFGYPVVEAMMAGKPVATSNTSSLAELGADAALLFRPDNVAEIADAMQQLISNEETRENYAKKGIMKSQEFTWRRYYKNMMAALEASTG